jgi:hypothetical protein
MPPPVSPDKIAENLWWFVPLMLIILSPLAFLYISIPWQARKRGYSFWIWFIACVINLNLPIYLLVLLSLVPNRARKRQRLAFRAELEAKLAKITSPVSVRAFGGPTMPPGSTATVDRSLGDMPTIVPRERSLGDDETRG